MNKKRMLTIMAILILSGIGLTAYAQNAVAIHQKDGKVAMFAFTEKPVVTYSGSNLVLTTTKTTVQYPVYMLKKLVFDVEWTESVSHVENIQMPEEQFYFHNGTLTISGGQPDAPVMLYSIKGTKVGQWRLDSNGRAEISLEMLGRDIYIVKTNRFSFKFQKP